MIIEYFIISQDKRFIHAPILEDFFKIAPRIIRKEEDIMKMPDINFVYECSRYNVDFIDIIDDSIFLVSKMVRDTILMFTPKQKFKLFCVVNKYNHSSAEYYLPVFPVINCLSEETQFSNYHQLIKLVLNKAEVKNYVLFKLKGIEKNTIVLRIDLAESLLRREVRGMSLKRVEVK